MVSTELLLPKGERLVFCLNSVQKNGAEQRGPNATCRKKSGKLKYKK